MPKTKTYPQQIKWKQGSTEVTYDLLTKKMRLRKLDKPFRGVPHNSIRVVNRSTVRPPRQKFAVGEMIARVVPTGIKFIDPKRKPRRYTLEKAAEFRMSEKGYPDPFPRPSVRF